MDDEKDILKNSKIGKYVYEIYYKINTSNLWIKNAYYPLLHTNKTNTKTFIFSIKKIINDLTKLVEKLEKVINDE